MITTNLQGVTAQVVRRARRQGYVVPREVREELTQAGLPGEMWKEVVTQTEPLLICRSGRYYFPAPVSEPMRQEMTQQERIRRAVRRLIRAHKEVARVERRRQDRMDYIQTVRVRTEDGNEFTLLSRDLSSTGIRLVGTRRLLGHKVRVSIPLDNNAEEKCHFMVRILWTCAIGDDMFENGGNFLDVENA